MEQPRSLFELTIQVSHKNSEISKIITGQFYVNDFFNGADSVETAAQICFTVTNILGCFELRKFCSNNSEVLKYVEQGDIEVQFVDFGEHENAKNVRY